MNTTNQICLSGTYNPLEICYDDIWFGDRFSIKLIRGEVNSAPIMPQRLYNKCLFTIGIVVLIMIVSFVLTILYHFV